MLADWRTAPIDDRLRAMLGYLEKLTLAPESINPADVDALRGAGIGEQGIIDATYVCVLFNMIDRIADALGFAVPADFAHGAASQLRRGYNM